MINRKGPWEGYIFIERETSGYEAGDRTVAEVNEELKKPRRQRPLKSEFGPFQTLSSLFHFLHFV